MKHIDDAIAHAKQSYPHESCGFFVLKNGKLQYVACTNLAAEAEDEFLIGIEDYARAESVGKLEPLFIPILTRVVYQALQIKMHIK
ncbi:MPN domain-containing protein [Haemophilus influenzae]|uniref:hypothetical protein n=1 Tax=Haemophilus influenzae TaxID=727 RepID=UPI00014FCF2E|nr:hypothetical protein [Haemophilus influenzae]EDK06923.1 phage protein; peptidase [Haemophilus influenzae PittAA]